ncbi:MAG: beta-galactosidase [bacterium]
MIRGAAAPGARFTSMRRRPSCTAGALLILTLACAAAAKDETSFQLLTDKPNNICAPGDAVVLTARIETAQPSAGATGTLTMHAVDFYGNTVWETSAETEVRGGEIRRGETAPLKPGFYRLRAALRTEKRRYEARTSLGVIEQPRDYSLDSPFGINFGDPELIRRAGIRWVRVNIPWRAVEAEKGSFDFEGYDRAVDAYVERGIGILAVLMSPPDRARRVPENYAPITRGVHAGWGDFPPNDVEAWGNYVFETVSHFKDRVKHWEIWNEPWPHSLFFAGGTYEDYADLLRVAHARAKEADPDCVIVGLGGTDHWHAANIFELGGFQYMDKASIHVYQAGLAPEWGWFRDVIRKAQEVITRFGGGKGLWITESGWPTNRGISEGWQGISLEDNARFLVRAHLLALAEGVEKYFWFSFRDAGTDPSNFEHNMGILFHDGTPKPSYVAYSVLTNTLRGAALRSHTAFGADCHAALFEGEDRFVYAAWADPGTECIVKPAPEALKNARVIVMMGAETPVPANEMTITDSPVYIVLPDRAAAEALGEAFQQP